MNDAHTVTEVALWLSGASFAVYIVEVGFALFSKPVADAKQAANNAVVKARALAAPTIDDLTKLIDSLSKLTDSLSKAGPSLTSLIAAVLFLGVAALSSGAFRSSTPAPSPPAVSSGGNSSIAPSQVIPAPSGTTGKPQLR